MDDINNRNNPNVNNTVDTSVSSDLRDNQSGVNNQSNSIDNDVINDTLSDFNDEYISLEDINVNDLGPAFTILQNLAKISALDIFNSTSSGVSITKVKEMLSTITVLKQ